MLNPYLFDLTYLNNSKNKSNNDKNNNPAQRFKHKQENNEPGNKKN